MTTMKPHITVRAPSTRYLDELVGLTCGPDLLALKVFPNAKEVTESFAAYGAVRKYLRKVAPLGDSRITGLFVGDGNTPRTAATFAFRTAWQCVSVDPRMKDKRYDVKRLTVIRSRVEDMPLLPEGSHVVIVAVHSHASLAETVKVVSKTSTILGVVAMPCCFAQELPNGSPPCTAYYDWGVLSEKRMVKVWWPA